MDRDNELHYLVEEVSDLLEIPILKRDDKGQIENKKLDELTNLILNIVTSDNRSTVNDSLREINRVFKANPHYDISLTPTMAIVSINLDDYNDEYYFIGTVPVKSLNGVGLKLALGYAEEKPKYLN